MEGSYHPLMMRDQRELPGSEGEPPLAAKADDLGEIKNAVEDAAAVSGGLWLSYLFVLFYIAIAAGAVTHGDLLLERPVKLPFLNTELPLLAFCALAPFLFLVTHAYTLAHFVMLGKKALRFHEQLRRELPGPKSCVGEGGPLPGRSSKEIRDKLRHLLPSNIFVQILAGPPETRGGMFGFILKLIALATLVLFPVLLLLLLQSQFCRIIIWELPGRSASRSFSISRFCGSCGRLSFPPRARTACPGSGASSHAGTAS
jgi:hypothetical protein